MQNYSKPETVSTLHITMDDSKFEAKPDVLFKAYSAIDARARQLAPENIRNELKIVQDGRIKTKFYVTVSNRMAPHLLQAIQQQIDHKAGMDFGLYFQKLQEQLMSQMFGPEPLSFNIKL